MQLDAVKLSNIHDFAVTSILFPNYLFTSDNIRANFSPRINFVKLDLSDEKDLLTTLYYFFCSDFKLAITQFHVLVGYHFFRLHAGFTTSIIECNSAMNLTVHTSGRIQPKDLTHPHLLITQDN